MISLRIGLKEYKYCRRIIFGTDLPACVDWYRKYYRFLETDDEYFNHDLSDFPGQGRWGIYSIYLPDDILREIYYQNAQRIFSSC